MQLSTNCRLYSSIKEEIGSLLAGFYEIIPNVSIASSLTFALSRTSIYL